MAVDKFKTNYQTLTVEKCFSNHYVVPDYQREYVWKEDNVEQLLRDLIDAFIKNNQKPYFMGMTVVYSSNTSGYELVDGQQRVTTFFILLCAISHIYRENKDNSASVFEDKIHNMQLNDDGDAVDSYALELQYETSSECLNQIYHEQIPSQMDLEKCSASNK